MAELFILQLDSDEIQEEAAEFLLNQPALPEDVLCLVKAWQEDRDLSRQIGVFCIPEGQLSLSKDTLLLVVSKLRNNKARTQKAAIKCLNGQLALPEDVLHLIAEQLKDIDYKINQAAAEVLKCQTVLSDEMLQLVAEQLKKKDKNARAATVKALSNQTKLSKNMLQLIAEQLKDTDYKINQAAAEVLKCQTVLSDEMLQLIVKQLKDESYRIRAAAAKVFMSRTNLSQELLELIANQLMDQTLKTQESGLRILSNRNTSVLSKRIIQIVEAQLENGTRDRFILNPILEILASQSALSKRTLQLVARQLKQSDQYARQAVATFLKHQPVLPVEALESLAELITDDVYDTIGQTEAAEILKGQSSLPEIVLRLVEKPLCAKKSIYPLTWSEALEILKAQSVLSEERLQLIVESGLMRSYYFQTQVVEALFSQPYLHTGVLETHLLSFYETLLRRSFSEHLVWISQDSGSYLVKDSRHITWNNLVSSKRELELVQEVQKSLYAEWEMLDKGLSCMVLWYSY